VITAAYQLLPRKSPKSVKSNKAPKTKSDLLVKSRKSTKSPKSNKSPKSVQSSKAPKTKSDLCLGKVKQITQVSEVKEIT
jgi:hypothetical protein